MHLTIANESLISVLKGVVKPVIPANTLGVSILQKTIIKQK